MSHTIASAAGSAAFWRPRCLSKACVASTITTTTRKHTAMTIAKKTRDWPASSRSRLGRIARTVAIGQNGLAVDVRRLRAVRRLLHAHRGRRPELHLPEVEKRRPAVVGLDDGLDHVARLDGAGAAIRKVEAHGE